MCTCGIDMATQQATPATHSSACAVAGLRPIGRLVPEAAAAAASGECAGAATSTGGRGRRNQASGRMAARQNTPMPM